MYAYHFALRAEAFSLTPDPAFLYPSPGHAEALAALEVGLKSRRGLMVMTGEVGTGKTTLLYSLLTKLGSEVRTAYIANTKLTFDLMLQQALADFGVACAGRDRLEQLTAFNAFLHTCAIDGGTAALVIDEAQNLDVDAFENLRLLSNFETFTDKLLQIVLVGQPELETKLKSPSLRQVAERVAVHCHINPLSWSERRKYIEHRLQCVGGSLDLFTPGALRVVMRQSQGIPRRINIICHNALLFAYGHGARQVSRSHARAAALAREGRRLVTIDSARGLVAGVPQLRFLPWWVAAGTTLAMLGALVLNWRHAPPVLELSRTEAPEAPPPSLQQVVAPATRELQPPAAAAVGDAPVALAAEEHRVVAPGTAPIGVPRPSAAGLAVAPEEKSAPSKRSPDFTVVRVAPGATLASITQGVYGAVNADLLKRVQLANPQIVDRDRIVAGDTLRFPNVAPAGQP